MRSNVFYTHGSAPRSNTVAMHALCRRSQGHLVKHNTYGPMSKDHAHLLRLVGFSAPGVGARRRTACRGPASTGSPRFLDTTSGGNFDARLWHRAPANTGAGWGQRRWFLWSNRSDPDAAGPDRR